MYTKYWKTKTIYSLLLFGTQFFYEFPLNGKYGFKKNLNEKIQITKY